jgi:hypothetical protein
MKLQWTTLFAASACFLAAACHRTPVDSTNRPERPRTSAKHPYLIEGDELKIEQAQNLYDVVRLQRPAWLTRTVRNRQGQDATVVYLDVRKLGNLNVLREIPPSAAHSLQYLSPTEAQLRFGPTHGSVAAIVIVAAKG